MELRPGLESLDYGAVSAMAKTESGRYCAKRFDVFHTRKSLQLVYRAARRRLGVGNSHVFTLCLAELHVDHEVHRITEEPARDHDGAGKGNADDGKQRLDGLPPEVPQNHPRRLRKDGA